MDLDDKLTGFEITYPARVAFIDDIIAQDRYTVVVETNTYNADWSFNIGRG